jgi:hypothetical protein
MTLKRLGCDIEGIGAAVEELRERGVGDQMWGELGKEVWGWKYGGWGLSVTEMKLEIGVTLGSVSNVGRTRVARLRRALPFDQITAFQ